jgi:hypothetical protein
VRAFPVENAQNNNSFMHGRLTSGKMRREDVEWRDFGAKIYSDK